MTVVDIGDSASTHLRYLRAWHPEIRSLSVNVAYEAVTRIRRHGLEAIHCRAEDLAQQDTHPDLLLSFEMLEHFHNPLDFMTDLTRFGCPFVVTVPYVQHSRVGLHHIRHQRDLYKPTPENIHLFELSPPDWRLLFEYAGWRVATERIYRQYPRWHPLRALKSYWRWIDFEGYYGVVLSPDATLRRSDR